MATTIPVSQARAQFTADLIDFFSDQLQPSYFMRSFFPSERSFTRYVNIEVIRNYENKAVDVIRGTEGNRNNFSKSTEKVIDPAYYKEFFDLTNIDLYDRLAGSTSIDAGVYSQMMRIAGDRLQACRNKIEREQEFQCANILQTGIVSLTNATNIDFGRTAASLVANNADNTWATGTVDPMQNLEDACVFLRQTGKCAGDTFNAILGTQAFAALKNNTIFKAKVTNILSNVIDTLRPPQRNSVGGTFHGTLSCGAYRVNLWTYNEYYDVSGTSTPYWDPKKVTVIPEQPRFKLAFAAVPQLIKAGTGLEEDMELAVIDDGMFIPYEVIDVEKEAHKIGLKSAFVPVPTAVDQMYTFQPVA